MKRKSRLLLPLSFGALCAVLMLALAGAIALLLGANGRQRLPDGSTVELESVGYGTQHVRQEGNYWLRRVAAFVPALQSSGTISRPSQKTLCFNLFRSGSRQPASPPWYRMATFDEHGCQFSFFDHWEAADPSGKSSDQRMQALAPTFPRRAATVGLGFYPSELGATPLAAFRTSNPTPGSYPTWQPETYPITKRSSDWAVTLTGLKWRTRFGGTPLPYARYSVQSGGRQTSDWTPVATKLSDPTGNSAGMTEVAEFAGEAPFFPLCTHEPAWKLRIDFAIARPLRMPPDLSWTINNIPVPTATLPSRSTATFTKGPVKLALLGVAQAGTIEWVPGLFAVQQRPSVRMRVRPGGKGLQVTLARVTDDRGRDLTPLRNGSGPTESRSVSDICDAADVEKDLTFDLRIPSQSKRLNFTFLAHRTRRVEFLASPKSLQ